VANERGIVLEEWRGGQGSGERMLRQWLPVALRGSRYAERLPIGTAESIRSATPAKLRRFYQDWYRPDLMAVVAVGDFDPARIEQLIVRQFGDNPRRANPRPRLVADVPPNAEPLVAVATDPEATRSSVTVLFKRPARADAHGGRLPPRAAAGDLPRDAERAARRDRPEAGRALPRRRRLERLVLRAHAGRVHPLGRGGRRGDPARARGAARGGAPRGPVRLPPAELEREKQDLLRGYERAYAERATTPSGSYVGEYVSNFLEGDAFPGIEYEYALVRQLLPAVTVAEVNGLARAWITDSNRVIVAQAPAKRGWRCPRAPSSSRRSSARGARP
jgi:zinc protease